jgi:hypothetical protein
VFKLSVKVEKLSGLVYMNIYEAIAVPTRRIGDDVRFIEVQS